MSDKPYGIIKVTSWMKGGTIDRRDYQFQSLVSYHSGPVRHTKAEAEADGKAFAKVLPEVLDGKIHPLSYLDDEVYTEWYYCPT